MLTGTGKLTLDIVGHVGLPKGVALAVVQSFETGRVKLVIFTDGKPERVLFAHISGTHIMPMTPAGKPFGMTWAEFAPVHEAWQVAGGQVTMVITKRCLSDKPGGTAVTLHPADRMGSSDPDSDDAELTIELGVVTEKQTVCVVTDTGGIGDDEEDKVVMALIMSELETLMTEMAVKLGFNISIATIIALLRGTIPGSQEFWRPFPTIHQYYKARIRREELYATQFDPRTVRFGDHVWNRSGSKTTPYPFPHVGVLS